LDACQGDVLLAGGALAFQATARDLTAKTALRHGSIGIGEARCYIEAQRRIRLDGR
jgi:hypothetical protein